MNKEKNKLNFKKDFENRISKLSENLINSRIEIKI